MRLQCIFTHMQNSTPFSAQTSILSLFLGPSHSFEKIPMYHIELTAHLTLLGRYLARVHPIFSVCNKQSVCPGN